MRKSESVKYGPWVACYSSLLVFVISQVTIAAKSTGLHWEKKVVFIQWPYILFLSLFLYLTHKNVYMQNTQINYTFKNSKCGNAVNPEYRILYITFCVLLVLLLIENIKNINTKMPLDDHQLRYKAWRHTVLRSDTVYPPTTHVLFNKI